jgi:hypothetical protein
VPTWLIIVIVVLLVLIVGGMIARSMLQKRTEGEFRARVERANHDLAEAAAADRGWDRATLESAAQRIFSEQKGAEATELLLVEVIDRPGTDQDQAVFRVGAEGGHHFLTLGRREGDWVLESLT